MHSTQGRGIFDVSFLLFQELPLAFSGNDKTGNVLNLQKSIKRVPLYQTFAAICE